MGFLGDDAYSLAFDGSLENRTLSSDGIKSVGLSSHGNSRKKINPNKTKLLCTHQEEKNA